MKFLIVGDVCGRPGREAFRKYVPELKKEHNIDVVVVNGENIAGGRGISRKTLDEIYRAGADIVTSGNHIWDQKEIVSFIDDEPFLIRPANYPEGAPGKGYCIYPFKAKNIGVINVSGRTFMPPMDCPFQKVDEILKEIKNQCDIILVDIHAEATSEKVAMGFYLDGKVTCVVGTHTHVQTADNRILPKGTAYISDLGMVGPYNSSLGINVNNAIDKFITCRPVRFEMAEGPNIFSAVVLELAEDNSVKSFERILFNEE